MAQYIKQAPLSARLGTGLAKGLAEQVPKEIERNRLASGLKSLEEQKGLTPFQQFSRLAAIPGITPQMLQSGSELLRQQARGQALADFQNQQNAPKPSPFPFNNKIASESKFPSITQEKPLEQIQEGYIPPTIEERDAIAGEAYNSNPAFFANDPQKAIQWADDKIAQEEKINAAYLRKHQNLNAIQDNVINRLKAQSDRLQTQVPAEVYSRIEDEAIQATKPKKEGGRGLTEQQAMKEYGEKLNDFSKDWSKIPTWGTWGLTQRSANETLRSMNTVQRKMEEAGATDLFAQQMQKDNQISPKLSFAIAQPVKNIPNLSSYMKSLKPVPGYGKFLSQSMGRGNPSGGWSSGKSKQETLKIAPELAKFVKENEKASPLAIGYELEKKGYDLRTWLDWLNDNADNLNLRQKQTEQLSIPQQEVVPMADWWLQSFSGVE